MEIRRINNGEIFYFGNDVIPKYSFNAKELDEETGMYYFEARYYRAPTFISRDPLMSEKPWLNPYHYCSNNPIGRVDPSGMSDEEPPPTKIPYRIENSEQKSPYSQSNNNTKTSTTATTKTQETKSIGEKIISTLKKIDNACEGSADPGNRGTITKQDIAVGGAMVGAISGVGVLVEGLPYITGYIIVSSGVVNNVDNIFTNKDGKSGLQQLAGKNETAIGVIGAVKSFIGIANIGYNFSNPQKIFQSPINLMSTSSDVASTAISATDSTKKK